jgi:protein required for attachment to host cells
MTTWIVVSNASRARVFSVNGATPAWTLVRELEHPASRAKGSELTPTEPGRMKQSAGQGRPAMEAGTPPKEVEAEHFAQELAHLLDKEYDHQAYSQLLLVAPPHFLGLLRKRLNAKLTKHLLASVDKDLTAIEARDLPERLNGALPAPGKK